MEEATLSIGEVAARVSVSALRYYERIGLLPLAEREQGRRRFPASTLRRIEIIAVAKRAGLSLAEVRSLLAAVAAGTPLHEPLRALVMQRLPEVETVIAEAERKRAWLIAASACGCESLDDCALFAT